jgi:hypothetical protein
MLRKSKAEIKIPPLIWRWSDKNRLNWDLIIICLALYNCVMIPLDVAFREDLNEYEILNKIETVIDILFILDIGLNFRTTFINPKTNLEITDPWKIAMNYARSIRFPVDVIASIPFEMFFNIDE